MKRILVLADLNANKLGSIEEFYFFLASELRRRGDECFLGFVAEPDPAVRGMFESAGARVADVFRGAVSGLGRIKALNGFIRGERIDTVHINFYCLTNPVLLGAYLSGASIVFTEHTSGSAPSRGALKEAASRALHFFMARRVARYVAVSDFVRKRIEYSHHVGREKSVTIYNGVNLGRFVPRDKARARERTGLPPDAKVVVAVAMLIPEKGVQHLVEAAAILVREYGIHNLRVVVAGEGYYRSSLEKMAEELGVSRQVMFLGRRNDVDMLVAASDAVAVPAVWAEAFGLIIAEAMAAGRPVVASRVGGVPELVEDRKTGILVEPGDGRGLAIGIRDILLEPELGAGLAANALEKARKQFDLARQAAAYAELFDEVMREKGA